MFVFVSLSPADPAPAALSAAAVLEVAEREGRTFVVPRARVETLGYQYTYPCRWAVATHIYTTYLHILILCRRISLEIHSSLDAVGKSK